MKSKWLISFKGRNPSLYYTQNFLWQNESIYIMDNHRAALWCWLQHIKENEKYNLLHMDRHYDTSTVDFVARMGSLPNSLKINIQDYLNLKNNKLPDAKYTIVYDNYLSIFYERFKNIIENSYFLTHNEGTKPNVTIEEKQIWKVPENLDFWLSNQEKKWIFNLDLDYFFCDFNDDRKLMFSDSYIDEVFKKIAEAYKENRILVMTIALSPEWTNGWEEAEKLCGRFCKIFELDFKLHHKK